MTALGIKILVAKWPRKLLGRSDATDAFTIYAICPNLDKPKTKGDSCSPPELQLIFAENALCVPRVNVLAHSKMSKRRKGSFLVKQRVSIAHRGMMSTTSLRCVIGHVPFT